MNKGPKKKYKGIRYTKKLAKFIADQVAEGYTISRVCKLHKDIMPHEKTVYKWQNKHPEFKDMMDEAYESFFQLKLGELTALSNPDWCIEYQRKMNCSDKEAFEARRSTLTALTTILTKIAPIFTERFNSKSTIKHEGLENMSNGPQILIQNYSSPVDSVMEIEECSTDNESIVRPIEVVDDK